MNNMDLQSALKWLELKDLNNVDLMTLKKKYRKLTLKYHPDKGGKTEDFVTLQTAYHFLQDCIKYPHSHKASSPNNSNSDEFNNNSGDIEYYKQQIIELKRSNQNYEQFINSQIKLIKQFYEDLNKINSQSDQYNSNLSKILDDELAILDKKYKSGWWKGVIGIKSMDKNDLIQCQNNLIDEHNRLLAKSQKDSITNNYQEYQKIVNQIVQRINAMK